MKQIKQNKPKDMLNPFLYMSRLNRKKRDPKEFNFTGKVKGNGIRCPAI